MYRTVGIIPTVRYTRNLLATVTAVHVYGQISEFRRSKHKSSHNNKLPQLLRLKQLGQSVTVLTRSPYLPLAISANASLHSLLQSQRPLPFTASSTHYSRNNQKFHAIQTEIQTASFNKPQTQNKQKNWLLFGFGLGQVTLSQVSLVQVGLGQVRLGQVILGYVRLSQVRLRYVTLRYVTLRYVTLVQVRLGSVSLGQVRLG